MVIYHGKIRKKSDPQNRLGIRFMIKIGQGDIGLMVYTHQKRQTASITLEWGNYNQICLPNISTLLFFST